jgi:ornithine cyclodeaminase
MTNNGGVATLLHLGTDHLGDLFGRINVVEFLVEAFKGAKKPPLRQRLSLEGGRELLVMPAISNGFSGVKILTVTPENTGTDRPAIQGLFALFDTETGEPLATIDAEALTAYRTAAVSAMAASRLARPDASKLALVGSGHLIPFLGEAHSSVRPIRQVQLWARNADRGQSAVERVRSKLPGIEIEFATDLEAMIGWGDIICSATRSIEPLIEGKWLRDGAHVDLVGGYRPDMREMDSDGVARSRIFVDTLDGALAEAGDLLVPIRERRIPREAILGDLRDLATSPFVRQDSREITLFKSVGTAAADLIMGAAAWEAICDASKSKLRR